jgi:glyoxylase-like metal-dependent hydrolase (beta-lactamase superfamily II)
MWFESIIRKETGCATYMIGANDSGECAVFDPLWDVEQYIRAASRKSSCIRYAIDSHCHADHVSGARRLTRLTGSELVLPELMDATYEATRVRHGQTLRLGEVSLEVLHVPGHRPEQINLLVRDHSRSEDPWCLLTADFLLVGDIARPDLALDGEEGAAILFDVAILRLRDLPDFVEVYPGHVAGST